jgi:hypothetical protein
MNKETNQDLGNSSSVVMIAEQCDREIQVACNSLSQSERIKFINSNQPSQNAIMWNIQQLPSTISDGIMSNLLEVAGHEFTQSIRVASYIQNQISCIDHETQAINVIARCLSIPLDKLEGYTLESYFVRWMGPGFCYLDCVQNAFRYITLKKLSAWPRLQALFSSCEDYLVDEFCVYESSNRYFNRILHMVAGSGVDSYGKIVEFHNQCNDCHAVSKSQSWRRHPVLNHKPSCTKLGIYIVSTPSDDTVLECLVGGFFSRMRSNSSSSRPVSRKSRSSISDSQNHEDTQVLKFAKTIKGGGIEPDMSRDLYSVPKPTEIETMTDHLQNHKSGDTFPYISVVGNEEESKDGRLSRLRAFRSSYGKESKPEMRINGVILDELEGTIKVKNIGDHVNKDRLSKQQRSENKKFRPISETSFKKPYLQVARITGEYVPLMSSTSDYTELYFTLEDGRLLDNQTIVQSNKLPTNQNGVFELSCDYCINLSDIDQLSLKYFLSRPVMKEGFQWGAVSLIIRVSESDTPYLTPKVEAMAIARVPFTTLEEHSKDPDHADVVFTAKQVDRFREMYRAGDIMDIDEPKSARTQPNSYSKSTIRGATKGESGPSHLQNQEGWEHLKGMVKPRLEEGVASISAMSGSEEDDIDVPTTTKEEYEKQQEALRSHFHSYMSDTTEEVPSSELNRSSSPISDHAFPNIGEVTPPKPLLKSALKKPRFSEPTLREPDTNEAYVFD